METRRKVYNEQGLETRQENKTGQKGRRRARELEPGKKETID